ncbi:hypothetical protein GOEFS_018_00465 [Gordonia effusa NBRC 100432]|uniref:Uncharacterized protein n=1 Tax=Gordonia effusa NBRC 100432 TaxID=1077974 RepID=H0QW13_9ACTN|nr:hypothetical protein GOEFS_018_00465 [Gordonia effusa NBRC 100432]
MPAGKIPQEYLPDGEWKKYAPLESGPKPAALACPGGDSAPPARIAKAITMTAITLCFILVKSPRSGE